MRKKLTRLSGLILRPSIICWGITGMPGNAMAAWPAQPHAAVQPVLITTLALTSLVLFLVYALTRKQPRGCRPQDQEDASQTAPAQETDLALEHLFFHQNFPMAKLSLDGFRILDATPSLLMALGYPKAELLGKTGEDLAMIRKKELLKLMTRGWNETEVCLFRKKSGTFKTCHIFNIICRSAAPPYILSIVSGLCTFPASESLPNFIRDLLDNRTIIQ